MQNKRTFPLFRPSKMPDGAPLDYAPDNELGVVFLFSYLARKRFGFRVERIQSGYPDCVAYRGSKRVRIEFEYRSRNFRQHGHNKKKEKCDCLVCWIHDWPAVPASLCVIELRKEFGLGFNVWFQPVGGEYRKILAKTKYNSQWSVPSQALEGDLLLYYRTAPDSHVRDVFRLAGQVRYVPAGWKPGKDWMGPIRRVCTLKAPLNLSELREHKVIRNSGFVRGSMRGRYRASEYWPELYDMIIARNPTVERVLRKYGPSKIS
jgi:hypothetical protein